MLPFRVINSFASHSVLPFRKRSPQASQQWGGGSSCTPGVLLPSHLQPRAWHFTHSKLCISSLGDGRKMLHRCKHGQERRQEQQQAVHAQTCVAFLLSLFSGCLYIYKNAWLILLGMLLVFLRERSYYNRLENVNK